MTNILYEDKFIIICVKPAGVLSQPGINPDNDMITILADYLKHKDEKAYIGPVHRLDRNVGGVMVFSKKQFITGKLSEAIRNREFVKEYLAVVHNHPKVNTGIFKDLLFKDSKKNKSFVVDRPRKGVKEASLEYKLLDTVETPSGAISLIKIGLHTGRTHQIRVQFASRKMPLVGDGKYGSRDNKCDIALWSHRLAFRHPSENNYIDFSSFPPDAYPWNLFKLK